MRRFQNPEMRVTFTSPTLLTIQAEDEVLVGVTKTVHKWLCTSNVHANDIIARVMEKNDPFQSNVPIPLQRVGERLL